MGENQSSNVAQLPDGWKMYEKYQIRHTDGTPLKGKKYFVLRLDSDNPAEAARVAAAMRAYKGELSNGNGAKMREALELVRDAHYEGEDNNGDGYEGFDVECDDGTGRPLICVVEKALAAPPRNCDVGTVEERVKRYHEFCRGRVCETCPAMTAEKDDLEDGSCIIQWEDMPYEEGGAK